MFVYIWTGPSNPHLYLSLKTIPLAAWVKTVEDFTAAPELRDKHILFRVPRTLSQFSVVLAGPYRAEGPPQLLTKYNEVSQCRSPGL